MDSQTLSRALVLIDEVWQIQSKLPYFSREPGALSCLPQLSEASTIARSEKAAALLAKLDSLDAARLPSMKAGRNTPRTLAGEMGMYQTAEEQFGRCMMDAFLTCRLVVDTGMNVLGWSLDQARDYMRAHAFMPETEVKSESLRYSCDMPGQSLAYKLGDTYLMNLRERMRSALGSHFDHRDFHDAVLKPGSLPLPLVAANVQAETERLLARRV